MIYITIQLTIMLWTWRLTQPARTKLNLVAVRQTDFDVLDNLGYETRTYHNFLRQQQRRYEQEVGEQDTVRMTYGFHCLLANGIVLLCLLAAVHKQTAFQSSIAGLLLGAGWSQNIFLWWYNRSAPIPWITQLPSNLVVDALLRGFWRATCGLESGLDLLRDLESDEMYSGRSARSEKLERLRKECKEKWVHAKINRKRWESLRPIFEIIGVSSGAMPAFLLCADQLG